MSVKRSGLGRNLTALLGTSLPGAAAVVPHAVSEVSIDLLHASPYQPRRTFDEAALTELAQSIQQQGLLQPILVRSTNADQFEIIAGERRWRACQSIGMTHIPVIVKKMSDEAVMVAALVENLQRENLSVLEQARGMKQLMESYAFTHQQVADVLSKSRSAVSNLLRLLSLSPEVQQLVEQGALDMGHARALLILPLEQQAQVAQMVVEKQLSVRATEAFVNRLQTTPTSTVVPVSSSPPTLSATLDAYLQSLTTALNTKVEIQPARRTGAGRLVIHFENESTLRAIVESL